MDAPELEAIFFEHVPEQFCRRALRMIFDARRRAFDHCAAEFPATEATNVRPFYTRGKVESQLREVADLHKSDGISHRIVKASTWNHTEILAGPVLLTAGAVQTPCGPVDKADFRLGLAASNQERLFDVDPDSSQLYTLLIHSGYRSENISDLHKYRHLPGSVYLAFPAADLDSYLHEISLFDRYPDIVEASMPQEWDQDARVKFMNNARKSAWHGVA